MNMKRMRGRNHRPNGGGGGNNGGGGGGFRNQQNGIPLNRNHVFDSSGPEMRVRGTAQQLYEKYQQLARDASSNGDRVTGEAYYQHAEHYFRIISAINQAQGHPPPGQPNGQPNGQFVQNGQNGQQPYQNANQGGGQPAGQERNGNYPRAENRPADGEPQNGQQNGHNGNQNRRFEPSNGNNGERQQDLQLGEPASQADIRPAEGRALEPQRSDSRPADGRPQESRSFEPRRNDQRNRPDFQRNDRNSERQERYRPDVPLVDARIDISSALEAELAAAVAEPVIPATLPEPEFHQPVLEARAIPIIPDAPPPVAAAPKAEIAAAPAPAAPKPRGRPRTVKTSPKE
jgi:hypothetical protein